MGLNIKQAIKAKGLTSKQVAERMNITPIGLSQHINGNPSVEVLERIAYAIGCDISELFDTSTNTHALKCPHCGGNITIKIDDV